MTLSVLPDTDPNEMAEANTAELDPITAELNAAEASTTTGRWGSCFCQCRRNAGTVGTSTFLQRQN